MDKYEYKLKTEQMLELMGEGAYGKAAEVADTIDWKRVRNVTMLSNVSEIYEKNRDYQKSYEVLNLAYHRAEGSRKIVGRLCTLALKTRNIDEAIDYYDDFVQIAPKDPNRYLLRYQILKAQRASIEQQIEALEKYKKAEYIEEWGFELAKLYQAAGMTAECLAECDDLILWFSEGEYVYQAMELKMKYKPLTPAQKEKYDKRNEPVSGETEEMPDLSNLDNEEPPKKEPVKEAVPEKEEVKAKEIKTKETKAEEVVEAKAAAEPAEPAKKKKKLGNTMKLDEALKSLLHLGEPENTEAAEEPETIEENVEEAVPEEMEEENLEELEEAMQEIESVVDLGLAEEILEEKKRRIYKVDSDLEELTVDSWDDEPEEELPVVSEEVSTEIEEEVEEELPVIEEEIEEELPEIEEEVEEELPEIEEEVEEELPEIEEEVEEELPEIEEEDEEELPEIEEEDEEELPEIQEEIEEVEEEKEDEEKLLELLEEVEEELEEEEYEEEYEEEELEEEEYEEEELEEEEYEEEELEEEEYEEEELEEEEYEEEELEEEEYEEEELEVEEVEEEEPKKSEPILPPDIQRLIDEIEGVIPEEEEIPEIDEELVEEEEEAHENMGVVTEQLRLDAIFDILDEDDEVDEYEDYEEVEVEDEVDEYEEYEEEEYEDEVDEYEDYEEEEYEDEVDEYEDYEEEEYEDEVDEYEDYEEEEYEDEVDEYEDYEEEEYEDEVDEYEDYEEEEYEDDYDDYEEEYEDSVASIRESIDEEFSPAEDDEWEDDREIPDEEEEIDILSATTPLSRKETAKLIATGKTSPLPMGEISDALSLNGTGFVVHGKYDLKMQSGIGTRAGLTEEQKKLFSYFVPVRGMSEQLVDVLEQDKNCTNRRGTSCTGNLVVIGNKGNGKTVLAVDVVKAIQKQRNIRQGKVAIVTGDALNQKKIGDIVSKLYGGALIIEKAGKMNEKTVAKLNKAMEHDTGEMLIVLEDQRKPLDRLLSSNRDFRRKFTSRLEVPIFINDELVTFGQTYAQENGYRIDEMGILALYSRIDMLQREDHAVTVAEVKDVMDEAIARSQKASAKKLVKRVFGRNTDSEDRIILGEKEFNI